jgi:Protein ENHANCED DISEASE RESISTANCE 2, C-terminal
VKSVVGGKPALLGKKVPINWIYKSPSDTQALYLEADLDIAASSAARGILSVTRSYTQVLTLNLGFVVEGCNQDELPEQMLVGARLHGIDPLTAPAYPADTSTALLHHIEHDDESGDITCVDG